MIHKVAPREVKPGDHLYSYRKLFTYFHHAIAVEFKELSEVHLKISDEHRAKWSDKIPRAPIDREACAGKIVVVEQNIGGIQVATLEEFASGRSIRRVRYGVSNTEVALKRAGTCYTQKQLPPTQVVKNALYILEEKPGGAMFETYNLFTANCENLALMCSGIVPFCVPTMATMMAQTGWISSTVLGHVTRAVSHIVKIALKSSDVLSTIIKTVARSRVTASSILKVTRNMFSKTLAGSWPAAVAAFAIEIAYYTVRLSFQIVPELQKWAIKFNEWLHGIIRAALGHGLAVALSFVGVIFGVILPFPGSTVIGAIIGEVIGEFVGQKFGDIGVGFYAEISSQLEKKLGKAPTYEELDEEEQMKAEEQKRIETSPLLSEDDIFGC